MAHPLQRRARATAAVPQPPHQLRRHPPHRQNPLRPARFNGRPLHLFNWPSPLQRSRRPAGRLSDGHGRHAHPTIPLLHDGQLGGWAGHHDHLCGRARQRTSHPQTLVGTLWDTARPHPRLPRQRRPAGRRGWCSGSHLAGARQSAGKQMVGLLAKCHGERRPATHHLGWHDGRPRHPRRLPPRPTLRLRRPHHRPRSIHGRNRPRAKLVV